MSKIEEFENNIIKNGMNDSDFEEYGKLLKRVHGNFSKRQHCYLTAIKFSPKNAEQAVKLINYGLESFDDGWSSTYTSYLHLGRIYEMSMNYPKAYESYLSAQNIIDDDKISYQVDLSIKLLWMRLHIDSFQYSRELEYYYRFFQKADEFSKAFITNEFKMAVSEIVIALHYGKNDEAMQAYKRAINICKPDYAVKLQNILSKHHYKDELKATQESLMFLKKIKL